MKGGPLIIAISIIALVFLILPVLITVPLAFSKAHNLAFPPPGFSLRWFVDFIGRDDFMEGLRVSIIAAVISSIFSTLLAAPASYGLVRMSGRTKVLTDIFLSASLLVPVLVIGVSTLFFFAVIGIAGTLQGLILGQTMLALPLVIRTIVAAMENYNPSLEEAAASLGAPRLRVIWEAVLPQVRTGVTGGAALVFVITLADTTVALFLRGPNAATLPTAVFSYMRSRIDPMIGASSLVFIVVSLIMLIVLDRLIGFEAVVGMHRE